MRTTIILDHIVMMANNIEYINNDVYISKQIYEHYNQIPTYTLEQTLDLLNISKLAFKKYYQNLGFQTFTEFKENIIFCNILRMKQIQKRYELFQIDKIMQTAQVLNGDTIDLSLIDKICYEIHKHSRIICYGSPTILMKLFDFQIDMKVFDKTVLLSSIDPTKRITPHEDDLIVICTATGSLFQISDASFKEAVLNKKNTKILICKDKKDSELFDYILSTNTKNDYYEMHYLLMIYLDLVKTRYYELYVRGNRNDNWENYDDAK